MRFLCTMKCFLVVILLTCFVWSVVTQAVKPTASIDVKKAQCYVNNNFFAGPNCKKIEQQLAEIKEEIRAQKRNLTTEQTGRGL